MKSERRNENMSIIARAINFHNFFVIPSLLDINIYFINSTKIESPGKAMILIVYQEKSKSTPRIEEKMRRSKTAT